MFDGITSKLIDYDFYDNKSPNDSEETGHKSAFETIQEYTNKVCQSIKNTLACTINTNECVNQSLADIHSQNEQISRIKVELNQSHDTVTITEQLVEKYVNSMKWITNSISWTNSMILNTQDGDFLFYTTSGTDKEETSEDSNDIMHEPQQVENIDEAIENFSNIATVGLNHLLDEFKNNRNKAELLSSMINKQNEELENINTSSQILQDRVIKVNAVLKNNT